MDESCISNPKSEILDWTVRVTAVAVQFAISDFGFEISGVPTLVEQNELIAVIMISFLTSEAGKSLENHSVD